MAEKQAIGTHTAQQHKCQQCTSNTDHMHACKHCRIEFCAKCARPELHNCGSIATWLRHGHATTTSKAMSLAIDAQEKGMASSPPAIPKPVHPRKPIWVFHVGQNTKKNYRAPANATLESEAKSFKIIASDSFDMPELPVSDHRGRPPNTDGYRPRSTGPEASRSPEVAPKATHRKRPHQKQEADHKATHRSAASSGGTTKQPRHSSRTGGEVKKRRKRRHQIHTPTDSELYHSSQERATSSKDQIGPAAQPPRQPVKTAQWERTAEEDPYLELTHTYTIAETVYKAVSATIQAGHELDHHRTTWAL